METLISMIDGLAENGDKPAVIVMQKEGSQRWTYRDMAGFSRKLAGGLIRAGLSVGDRVAIRAAPGAEWILACLAVIRAGGVAVPLDTQLDDKLFSGIVKDCSPRWIFMDAGGSERMKEIASEAGIEPASSGVAPGKVELARSSRQRAPGQGRRQHLAAVRSSRSLSRAARPVVPSAAPRLALPFRAPAQGKLVFDLKPGLHVRLDGRPLGQTPLAPIWVDEGRRTLLVTSPFRYRTKRYQVVIRAGRTASVSSDEG